MGIWKWVQEKASSIYQGAKTVVSTVQSVIVIAGDLLSTEAFRKGFSNWFIQSWQGFARVLDPSVVVSLLTRPKSGRVWMRGEATALARLIPVVIYQVAIRPNLGTAVRSVTNNGWAEFAAVGALDLAAGYVFTRRMIAGAADNVACSMAMAKATTVESASEVPTENRLAQSCPHDNITQLTAGFNSSVYYYGNRLALYALARTLPYGEYLTLPLQALFYGWTFLEYPLGAAGNCAEHRLEVLTKNNPYAMGVGASYLAAHRALQWLMDRYVGANGFFVDEVLASMLSLHFIMVSNLSRNLPLPGTEQGSDPFYLGRAMTDLVVTQTMNYIEDQYKGAEESDWYKDLKKNLGDKWDLPAVRALRFALLYDELQDSKKLAMRPTARMYLELCGADIETGLQAVIDMREDSYYQTVDYFKNVLPNVMGDQRKKLSLAMNRHLEEPLHVWLDFIREVRAPEFGTVNQKDGLYGAARRERALVRQKMPNMEALPSVDSLAKKEDSIPKADVQGLYGVARKRFVNTQSMPVLGGKPVQPSPPVYTPSPPLINK